MKRLDQESFSLPSIEIQRRTIGLLLNLCLIISFLFLMGSARFASADAGRRLITVEMDKVDVQIGTADSVQLVSIALQVEKNRLYNAFMPPHYYQIKEIAPKVYHLRYKDWKDLFWKIDVVKRQVNRVTHGSFGIPGGYDETLTRIFINETSMTIPGKPELIPAISLDLFGCAMKIDTETGSMKLVFQGDELSGPKDWDVKAVTPDIYHVKLKPLYYYFPIYWKVDVGAMKVAAIQGGTFGAIGGTEGLLAWGVRADLSMLKVRDEQTVLDKKQPEPSNKNVIIEDMGMKFAKGDAPRSEWFEHEKILYRNILKQNSYDILIVPFQVQGYAIDRIGRSLMTRHLAHRIEVSSQAKIPSPTLVAKAMGELSRRFIDEEAFQLANDLKVKTLIRGYVGHNRDQKMSVTLIIQSRSEHGVFSSFTKSDILEWKGIPFSDEQLPEEAFYDLLNEIMAKVPVKQTHQVKLAVYKKEPRVALPETPLAMLTEKHLTPVITAYYLQLLGALYPQQTADREYLFERSLVALTEVSPKSPDYALLKARAYYYLNRRPAALAALKSPAGTEEKAFTAFLNGNLSELESTTKGISNPLLRLLAEIELNDLRWAYDNGPLAKTSNTKVISDFRKWNNLVVGRLTINDVWEIQSNLQIKQILDEYFPIPDYTARTILRGNMALGEIQVESDDIVLSVYGHYQRLLENYGLQFSDNETVHLVKRDVLSLLTAIGESNILKNIRLRLFIQGSYEAGLESLNHYEPLYGGHPEFSYLRSRALQIVSQTKHGQAHGNLQKLADDIGYKTCYWYQGQTIGADQVCKLNNFYDGDYPRRWFYNWNYNGFQEGDRNFDTFKFTYVSAVHFNKLSSTVKNQMKNLDLALRYTCMDVKPFNSYFEDLIREGLTTAAETLVEANRDRFLGSPRKASMATTLKAKTGNDNSIIKSYEEAITTAPNTWSPYERLADFYISKGDFSKAVLTYNRFPPFQVAGGTNVNEWNTVVLSNYAYSAGSNLRWHGAIQESMPFFKLSAGYKTGSGAEMASSAVLSLIKGNYLQAARHLQENAQRYKQGRDYDRYAALLHVIGFHEEGWSLYNNQNLVRDVGQYKQTPFIAHRMEGKTEEEQQQWLAQRLNDKMRSQDLQEYILYTHLNDRPLNEKLPDVVEEFAKKTDYKSMQGPPEMQTVLSDFSRIHNSLRKRQFSQAWAVYNRMFVLVVKEGYESFWFALPYGAWASVKNGSTADFESFLDKYRKKNGENFYYKLAQAFLLSGNKKYKDSIDFLKSAQYAMPLVVSQSISPWYQLIEACEWLYEDTKVADYRELILTFAKISQGIYPTYAWPYAFEAKYTTSESDRIRTLAITLYLDKRSDHISKISEREKKKALKWLEKNNPFLNKQPVNDKSEV